MADKLMNIPNDLLFIHKITHFVDYNKWLKRLDTQLNELTNQNSIVPKVLSQRIQDIIVKL